MLSNDVPTMDLPQLDMPMSHTNIIQGEQHAASLTGTLHSVTEKNHWSRVRVSGVRRVRVRTGVVPPKAVVKTIIVE